MRQLRDNISVSLCVCFLCACTLAIKLSISKISIQTLTHKKAKVTDQSRKRYESLIVCGSPFLYVLRTHLGSARLVCGLFCGSLPMSPLRFVRTIHRLLLWCEVARRGANQSVSVHRLRAHHRCRRTVVLELCKYLRACSRDSRVFRRDPKWHTCVGRHIRCVYISGAFQLSSIIEYRVKSERERVRYQSARQCAKIIGAIWIV